MFTNTGLVAYAKKALAENYGYCLGTYGQILTEAVLNSKCAQGGGVGEYNTKHKNYLRAFLNRRVSDCYGLIKGYCWGYPDNGKYASNGFADRNQESAYNAAKQKGTLATMPEIPGIILWLKGHAGIYIGNGEFIECAGAPTGMFKGKIQNGRVTSGSRFTHWFMDTYINYGQNAAVSASSPPITAETPVTEYQGRVTATTLNIRGGAGTSFAAIGSFKQNDVITIIAETSVGSVKWGKAKSPTGGWVSLDFVTKIAAPTPLSQMTFAQALDIWITAGVIVDRKYWENAAKNLNHLDTLFINAARKGFKA